MRLRVWLRIRLVAGVAVRSTEVQAEFLKSRLNVAQKLQAVLTNAKG